MMRNSIRTREKVGFVPRRRKKKAPAPATLRRVEWLNWLVERYGASVVSDWQEAPVNFEAWCRDRELAAHEAA